MDEGASAAQGAQGAQGTLVGGWWGPAATDVMSQLCRVCGEPAAGFHFGAFTCEGCKSFFGRTYNNLGSISECKNQGTCVINKKNRTSCKACRLRKCLLVGMSKSGSRYGRRSNWFKIHCLLQEQQHQQQQHQQHHQQQQHQQQAQQLQLPEQHRAKPFAPAFPGPGVPGVPGVLWPHTPPPHMPPLPFLGAAFLSPFNGGPPMFPIPPRPEWATRLSAPAAAPNLTSSPPPDAASSLSPPSRRTQVPPRTSAAIEQEQPMDLSRTATTPDSVVPLRVQDGVGEQDDKDEGSDSGVSERESDGRAGDAEEAEGPGDVAGPAGAGPPLLVPSPLDLSSRA